MPCYIKSNFVQNVFIKSKRGNFLSHYPIEFDIPNCDLKWVSYRKTDGAIFGDHCF